MAVNYNDSRFTQVEEEKNQALNEVNNLYGTMVNDSQKYYQDQIDAVKDYADTQANIQQENTDFAIEKVEQQKEWAEQDYTKEQKGAYADWQKQSNEYGANAEALASQGMTNTGYADTQQTNMYVAYQNRVATARESYNRAVVEYDNAIKEAQLQNNSALAEIAFNALQTELELSLQGFQYKNQLLQTQLEQKNNTEDRYYSRWQNVLQQINTENALAEQVRQYNESMKLQRDQFNWQKQQAQLSRSSSGGSSGGKSSTKLTSGSSSSKGGSSSGLTSGSNGKSDAEVYGTFKNGYQPKGISGYGELKASKYKVKDVFMNDGSSFSKQNIWQAGGHYFVWDGSIKDYVDVTDKVKTSVSKKVNYLWGN